MIEEPIKLIPKAKKKRNLDSNFTMGKDVNGPNSRAHKKNDGI